MKMSAKNIFFFFSLIKLWQTKSAQKWENKRAARAVYVRGNEKWSRAFGLNSLRVVRLSNVFVDFDLLSLD